MPLNINEFKSAIHKYDLERPSLFEVGFSIPNILKTSLTRPGEGDAFISKTESGKLLTLFCKSANLPGLNITTAETVRYGIGPSIKMPVRGSLNDISMTFLNDSNSFVYGFFYLWMELIYGQTNYGTTVVPGRGGSFQFPFKKEYQTDVKMTMYHGKPGQFQGLGLLQTAASVISSAAGVPFLGSLIGSISLPQVPLVPVKRYSIRKLYPTNISDISLSTSATDTFSEFTVNFAYQTFDLNIFV
jgi:hypothetical protein